MGQSRNLIALECSNLRLELDSVSKKPHFLLSLTSLFDRNLSTVQRLPKRRMELKYMAGQKVRFNCEQFSR